MPCTIQTFLEKNNSLSTSQFMKTYVNKNNAKTRWNI